MYCIEGEVTTRRKPETLIGQFGAFYTDVIYDQGRVSRTFKSMGSLEFVENEIERWVDEERVLPGVAIELIDDVSSAEKYISEKDYKTGLECKEEPNPIEVVTSRIAEEHELLIAKLALWKEVRKPFSKIYSNAEGTLIGLLHFDSERGWHEPHERVKGERRVTGLATPRRHDITVVDHIEASDSRARSYYPTVTISDATKTHRSNSARFLNITKAVKKANSNGPRGGR